MLGAVLREQRLCPAVELGQGSHPSDTASSKCGMWLGGSEGVCVCMCDKQVDREKERTQVPSIGETQRRSPSFRSIICLYQNFSL